MKLSIYLLYRHELNDDDADGHDDGNDAMFAMVMASFCANQSRKSLYENIVVISF